MLTDLIFKRDFCFAGRKTFLFAKIMNNGIVYLQKCKLFIDNIDFGYEKLYRINRTGPAIYSLSCLSCRSKEVPEECH